MNDDKSVDVGNTNAGNIDVGNIDVGKVWWFWFTTSAFDVDKRLRRLLWRNGHGRRPDRLRRTAHLGEPESEVKLKDRHRFLHAYPSIDNPPSNALCRKLGFELMGEYDFEYPPGHQMRCNDWRFDLFGL